MLATRTLILVLLVVFTLPASAVPSLRFGVLAARPKEQVIQRWKPFAAYLEATLGMPVELTAYYHPDLNDAVAQNQLDVVLTNSGHYIMLKQHNKLSAPLATLIAQENGLQFSTFGGVIFTRAEAAQINTLADLIHKRIAIVGTESLGGYQMQAFEFAQAGLPLPDRENLYVTGQPHDQVVAAVLADQADAGFVRTGLIESMAREGKLDLRLIKIIQQKNFPTFPLISSTALYPEWPIAVAPHVDEQLAKRLTVALLSLQADSELARSLKIHGFTIPADYSGVENILRQLRMPPFDAAPPFTVVDMWKKYEIWINFLIVLILLLLIITIALVRQNRRVSQIMRYNRSLIEASLDPLVTISKDGKITDVNSATTNITGVSREQLNGSDFSDYFTDTQAARTGYQRVFKDGTVHDYPLAIQHRDGHVIDVLYNASVYRNEKGQVEGVFAAARDISERKHFEDTLRDREERLSLATLHNGVGIWDWNLQTQEMVWDDSMYALYHIRREDFSGTEQAWRQALHPDDLERGDNEVEAALSGEKPFDTEFRVCWPGGEIRYIKAVAKVFRDEEGKPLRMLGTNIDITDRKLLQMKLERQAHTDYLTEVSNRRYFMEQAELELSRSVRYSNSLSVLMMDIDFFKRINDSYGHKIGDAVLKKLAEICRETLREVDIIGRIGGEEFAVLLPETGTVEAAEAAERLRQSLANAQVPLENNLFLQFTVSIGVSSLNAKDNTIGVLLNLADNALYEAKESGRNKVSIAIQ